MNDEGPRSLVILPHPPSSPRPAYGGDDGRRMTCRETAYRVKGVGWRNDRPRVKRGEEPNQGRE